MNNDAHTRIFHSENGLRLDKALALLFPDFSRSQLKKHIESGHVTLNGKACAQPSFVLAPGTEVHLKVIKEQDSHIVPKEIQFEILYEDEEMLVVNKPAGLTVHPGAGNKENTLVNALLFHFGKDFSVGESSRPGIVHRLDKDTTGVMVVAKSQAAHTFLSLQFEKKIAKRKYLALLHSLPKSRDIFRVSDEGIIQTYITRDEKNRLKFKTSSEKGRIAISHFHVLQRGEYGILTEFTLDTGRTHQIRVHASHKKAPLVGDVVYGRGIEGLPLDLAREVTAFNRQALHAFILSCPHPTTKRVMEFRAEPPRDLSKLCRSFGIDI